MKSAFAFASKFKNGSCGSKWYVSFRKTVTARIKGKLTCRRYVWTDLNRRSNRTRRKQEPVHQNLYNHLYLDISSAHVSVSLCKLRSLYTTRHQRRLSTYTVLYRTIKAVMNTSSSTFNGLISLYTAHSVNGSWGGWFTSAFRADILLRYIYICAKQKKSGDFFNEFFAFAQCNFTCWIHLRGRLLLRISFVSLYLKFRIVLMVTGILMGRMDLWLIEPKFWS